MPERSRELRPLFIAVAMRGVRLDALCVTAVALRRSFIGKVRMAFARAKLLIGRRLTTAMDVQTLHRTNLPSQAHRHNDVAELAIRRRVEEAGTRLV
jgi:hypothetical protein